VNVNVKALRANKSIVRYKYTLMNKINIKVSILGDCGVSRII
jgi:hypothetical protein